jgi:hypothetical protein
MELNVRVDDDAPLILVNVPPLSELTCHWYIGLEPLTSVLKTAFEFSQTAVEEGPELIETGVFTTRVATAEFTPAGLQLATTARYL